MEVNVFIIHCVEMSPTKANQLWSTRSDVVDDSRWSTRRIAGLVKLYATPLSSGLDNTRADRPSDKAFLNCTDSAGNPLIRSTFQKHSGVGHSSRFENGALPSFHACIRRMDALRTVRSLWAGEKHSKSLELRDYSPPDDASGNFWAERSESRFSPTF